jgi:hypothetical protein
VHPVSLPLLSSAISRPNIPLLMPPCRQAHGGEPIIPFSGAYEAKIFDMSEEEKEEYNKEQGEGAACVLEWIGKCGNAVWRGGGVGGVGL